MKGVKIKQKKQKMIKNAIVDDDIKIDPGIKYINWISIAKTKLREREIILLTERAIICNEIIIASINKFTVRNTEAFEEHKNCVHIQVDRMAKDNFATYHKETQNKIIKSNSSIMCKCDQAMANQLAKWNGIKRTSKNISTFRQYFKLSKKWWDGRKIDILAIYFWIQIFNMIQEYTQKAANEFFCDRFFDLQNKYSKYLNILILHNLFEGTMKLPNSRVRLLIPAGSFTIFSKEINQNLVPKSNVKNGKKGTKLLRDEMVDEIINKHKIYKHEFQTALLKLHYEVDNYGKTQSQSKIDNNNKLNVYTGDHHASRKVQETRYNPY